MGAHFSTVKLDNAIRVSTLIPNRPVGSVISFNLGQGLKCKHVASTPTLTM